MRLLTANLTAKPANLDGCVRTAANDLPSIDKVYVLGRISTNAQFRFWEQGVAGSNPAFPTTTVLVRDSQNRHAKRGAVLTANVTSKVGKRSRASVDGAARRRRLRHEQTGAWLHEVHDQLHLWRAPSLRAKCTSPALRRNASPGP